MMCNMFDRAATAAPAGLCRSQVFHSAGTFLFPVITPVSPSFHPPSSGHQQSVQLPEGGPSAASGPGGPETGPLPGVWCSCSGPACVCVRTRRSLARLHLVYLFIC